MKNRIILVLFLLLVIGIASCGKKEEAVPEKISSVTGVKMETVKASPVEDFYEAVGTVRSKTTSVLSPKITGYILLAAAGRAPAPARSGRKAVKR